MNSVMFRDVSRVDLASSSSLDRWADVEGDSRASVAWRSLKMLMASWLLLKMAARGCGEMKWKRIRESTKWTAGYKLHFYRL